MIRLRPVAAGVQEWEERFAVAEENGAKKRRRSLLSGKSRSCFFQVC